MNSQKHKWIAGAVLFVGIFAVGLVIYNFVRLYTAMPSKTDVVNFAEDVRGEVVDAGLDFKGSLVPADSTATGMSGTETITPSTEERGPIEADWLSPEQRRLLTKLGIDESQLPKTLTPELEACFDTAIGELRVEAIKAGDSPTVVEGMKAMTCL